MVWQGRWPRVCGGICAVVLLALLRPPALLEAAPDAPSIGPQPKTVSQAEQPKIPIQEMIARVDLVLRVPEGLLTGRLSVINKSGESYVWDFSLYKKTMRQKDLTETAMLYQFSSTRRGLEAKVLYREDGETVWLWDAVRARIFRKRDLEKFQGVLGTGFTFLDLANAGFQAGYTGRTARFEKQGEALLAQLTMAPINPGRYSRLVLLARPADGYQPVRMDYHDRDRVLFKTLRFQYGDLLDKSNGRTAKVNLPVRLEMLSLANGTISRLEYFTFDSRVAPTDAFFDPEYINR